jgi:hypothetical protein
MLRTALWALSGGRMQHGSAGGESARNAAITAILPSSARSNLLRNCYIWRRPCTSTATSCPAPPGLTCAEPRHRAELRGALRPSTKKSSSTGPRDLTQMALACLRRHFTNAPFLLALEAKLGQPTPAPKSGKRNTGEASRSSAGCASTPDTIEV